MNKQYRILFRKIDESARNIGRDDCYMCLKDTAIPDHVYLAMHEKPCDMTPITDEERSNYQHLSRMNILESEEAYQHARLEGNRIDI